MRKINGIAFVQIVSALLIVNYHTATLGVPFLSQFARFGFIFNTVFVFLSGFLLAGSLSSIKKVSYKEFVYKRFIRIYPSFHIALLVIAMIYLVIGREFTVSSFLLAMTGFSYYFSDNTFGEHLWFVSVILVCYLLCIPTYNSLKASPLIHLMFICFVFIIVVLFFEGSFDGIYGKVSSDVKYRFIYHYMVFSLALYWGIKSNEITKQESLWKWFVGFSITFPLYLWLQPQFEFGLMAIFLAIVVAICTIKILLAMSVFFEKYTPWLFYFSLVTYEIYLIHYVVISAIDLDLHGQYIAYPLVFVVSVLLAFLIFKISRLYERLIRFLIE